MTKSAFHLIRKGIAIVFIISSVIGYNLFIAYKLIMTITRSCFYFDPAIRLLPSLPLSTFPPSLTSAWGHNRRLPPPRKIKKEVLHSVHQPMLESTSKPRDHPLWQPQLSLSDLSSQRERVFFSTGVSICNIQVRPSSPCMVIGRPAGAQLLMSSWLIYVFKPPLSPLSIMSINRHLRNQKPHEPSIPSKYVEPAPL